MRAFLLNWRWPLLSVLLVLTALTARTAWEQGQAWSRAVSLEKAGKLNEAIDEYRWTLRWYLPVGGLTDEAGQALLDLANRAEKDNPEQTLRALDALRSGLIAARSLAQPRADWVQLCNQRIPPLLVRIADRRGDKRDPASLLRRFQADYARPVGVGPLTSAAVSLGFLLWLLGLVQVIRRGINAEGQWQPAGWRWLGATFGGFALWVCGLYFG